MWNPVFNASGIATQAAVADQRIIAALHGAGAVDAESAVPFAPASPLERQRLGALLAQGAVREPVPGHFYVEEAWLAARRARERRLARGIPLVLVALLAVAVAVALLVR